MMLAQAMMGAPIVLAFIWVFVFVATVLFLASVNVFIGLFAKQKQTSQEARATFIIILIIASVFACLGCVFFIYRLINYQGPWIN